MKVVKKVVTIIAKILFWILITVGIVLIASFNWLLNSWSEMTIEELVYHLTVPLEGTNSDMVKEYILRYGIWELLVLILLIVACILIRKILLPKWKHVTKLFYIITLLVVLVAGVLTFFKIDKEMGVREYVKGQIIGSSFIKDNYVSPSDVELKFPEQKKNLIYLYLESMETTFTNIENGGSFQQNIIPELVDISREGDNFSGKYSELNGGISLYGSTWTMGAMFAASTGLPLKIGGVNANYIMAQDSLYPSVIGIGDILEQEGYQNELLLGSNATFGGRRTFYSSHGDYFMYDYEYAKSSGAIPEDYKVFWGYEDTKLFEFAKSELTRLSKEEKPFNLTMLTADTHFEDGYWCEKCEPTYYGGDQYSNVMACSSRQVGEFIDWIQEQDFYENTVIVISGDHPTMDKDFCLTVPEDYQRKVLTSVLNSSVEPEDAEAWRYYSTMDMFPTTLAAMGVEISGNHLGLGVNLYSDEQTLVEKYGVEYCDSEMEKKSEFMDSLNVIEVSDDLIRFIGSEAVITPIDEEDGLRVEFKAYAEFSEMSDFKNLEARIWTKEAYQKGEDMASRGEYITVTLDGYQKGEDLYYNSKYPEDLSADDIAVEVYVVWDDGSENLIKTYAGE